MLNLLELSHILCMIPIGYLPVLFFLYLKEFERRERMDEPILVHDFKLQNKHSTNVSPVMVLKV